MYKFVSEIVKVPLQGCVAAGRGDYVLQYKE